MIQSNGFASTRFRISILAAALMCLASVPAVAGITPYSQDFEGLNMADPAALTNDGWLIFGNVFDSGGGYKFGYGPFGAPNGGNGFSAIVTGEGGPPQGTQQLSVYNDYNCCDPGGTNQGHFNGTDLVESNVFQEQTIDAADVGTSYKFTFDAKRGNIEGSTTAIAFIKTLDPNAGFSLSNFITLDMTNTPGTWQTYKLSLSINPQIVGHILQFGFASTASNFEGSGIFYDNIEWRQKEPVSVEQTNWGRVKAFYR